jgi:hypothetical protein
MKITFEILGILFLVLAATAAVNYFRQRKREQKAQTDGVVVYATLVSAEPVRGFAKVTQMRKIVLRVQEPNGSPREVSIRTRVDPGQKFVAGAMLPMVIDPKDPRRVYPATPESAKRAVLTGSRQERRIMQSQLRTPSPGRAQRRPPSGYQPPVSKLR